MASYPQITEEWSYEQLKDASVFDILQKTYEDNPKTAIEMWQLLLDTAEDHLNEEETASFLVGEYAGWIRDVGDFEPLLDALEWDSHFAAQVFQSAHMIHKLERLTSAHEAQLLQRQVYLPGRIKSMNESIYYSVDAIHRAIAQDCQITFGYFSYTLTKERSYRRSGQPYQISPWVLTWDDENYYLIGYDGEAAILKHFRVDKMTKISLTGQRREGAELFRSKDMGIYSKKLFSMFGGEEESVKLQLPNALVGAVLDRFGKDTVLTEADGEHFQISERIIVSTQFFGWLAGLDHKAQIIAPKSVQQAYRNHLRSLLE